MNKKVLVTGAGGYIGRYVVNNLLEREYEVYAVDINTDKIDKRANIINIDIFSGDKDIYTRLGEPEICIHMAWRDGFVHNSEAHIKDLEGHYQFLKNMIDGGLKHVAIMGTMHEIGYWEGEIVAETPTNPSSLYGIAKNTLRQLIMLLVKEKGDVTLQWLRAFYIYGDDKNNSSIFSKIIKMEENGEKTFPFTSGKNQYDFISVEELALQITLAATQDKEVGIINCCTGEPMSLKERVIRFIEENNFKIRPNYGAFPDRPYDSPIVWGNNDKISRIMKKE